MRDVLHLASNQGRRDFLYIATRRKSARSVLRAVAAVSGVSEAEIVGPRQHNAVFKLRSLAAFLMRRECPHMSYPAIGRVLGDRDHTTIIHACRRWEEYRQDPAMREIEDKALDRLHSGWAR